MSSHSLDRYKAAVDALLLDYQWIEQFLKLIVAASYEVISRSVQPPVVFTPDYKSVDRDSLGRLIDKLAQVNGNTELIKNLRTLATTRNHCAHQAFVLTLEEQRDSAFLDAEARRMEQIKLRTKAAVSVLTDELAAISAALKETPRETARHHPPVDPEADKDEIAAQETSSKECA